MARFAFSPLLGIELVEVDDLGAVVLILPPPPPRPFVITSACHGGLPISSLGGKSSFCHHYRVLSTFILPLRTGRSWTYKKDFPVPSECTQTAPTTLTEAYDERRKRYNGTVVSTHSIKKGVVCKGVQVIEK